MKLLYCTVVLVSVGSTLASGGYGGGHGGNCELKLEQD